MRFLFAVLLLSVLSAPCALSAQESTNNNAIALVPAPVTHTPSAILKPALNSLQESLASLRPEKWKISDDTTHQTQINLTSIQNDLHNTLPPLLATADQYPDSVVQVLPTYRNIEALYDVLLRVTQVATLSAPTSQIIALQEAMDKLEKARGLLGERIQISAVAQAQQLGELQAYLRTVKAPPVPVCPPPPPPPPPPTTKKRRPHAKSTPKTTASAAATPAKAPATH
jgi:hypothetical protein